MLPAPASQGPSPAVPVAVAAVGGIVPATVIAIVDEVLQTVGEIGRCMASVAMEKQRTKQTRVMAEAQVEVARQQTKQMQIQQEEETRRYAMQCKNELDQKKVELNELRENLRLQNAQRKDDHQRYMASLDMLADCIKTLIGQSDRLCEMLSNEVDADGRQAIFLKLDQVNGRLIELAGNIVKLRQG